MLLWTVALITVMACTSADRMILVDRPVKLGDTVPFEVGNDKETTSITFKSGDEDKAVMEDEKVTSFGQQMFGERASIENGTFRITNIQLSDLGTYIVNQKDLQYVLFLTEQK